MKKETNIDLELRVRGFVFLLDNLGVSKTASASKCIRRLKSSKRAQHPVDNLMR